MTVLAQRSMQGLEGQGSTIHQILAKAMTLLLRPLLSHIRMLLHRD